MYEHAKRWLVVNCRRKGQTEKRLSGLPHPLKRWSGLTM